MALTRQTMTDEQRKSVALEYLKAFDNGGVTSTGESILELFATDAQVYFPKWGIANGREEIGTMFGDVGAKLKAIRHDYANFNWIFGGADTIVAEGTSYGEHEDGPWRADVPAWGAGRWCDVFEIAACGTSVPSPSSRCSWTGCGGSRVRRSRRWTSSGRTTTTRPRRRG